MKIAVTSQNRKTVTDRAGRCRKFWLFNIKNNNIVDKELLELAKAQAFHELSPHASHPLDDVDVLISGGMGQGLMMRLRYRGIQGLVTTETDPEMAVQLYLSSILPTEQPHRHRHRHCHRHRHRHRQGCRHGRDEL